MNKNKNFFSDVPLVILALLLVILVNLNSHYGWTSATDRFWYDQLQSSATYDAEDDIVIVEIDDQSLSLIGDWPWDRAYHAELIDILTLADTRFVAYNLAFSAGHLPLNASDYLLADSISRNGKVILPIYFDQILNDGPLEEVLPHAVFAEHAHLGHVNVYLDGDGVYRRAAVNDFYRASGWPHFALSALQQSDPSAAYHYLKDDMAYIRYINRGKDFKRYSFVDVITGEVDLPEFYQKKVFVGVTATSVGDPLITPVSQNGQQMSAVDINANIYQMLELQQDIRALPVWITMLVNTMAVLLMAFFVPRLSMVNQVLSTVIAVTVVLTISWLAIAVSYWYQVAGLVFSLLVIPFAWNSLRLSRLFHYFRTEAVRLEQQQHAEQFHFPDQLVLESREALNKLLNMLGIHEYQLDKGGCTDMTLSEQGEVLERNFPLMIADKPFCLTIRFSEYAESEKRQVQLLSRLFEPSSDANVGSEGHSSDIFSRQLNLIQTFQDYIDSSQHLFESSIQSMTSAVIVADLAGSILFRNERVARFIDSSASNLFEILDLCQLLGEDSWQALVRRSIAQQHSVTAEVRVNGYDLSVSVRCLEDKSARSPLLVVNMSDISQVKAAQRARNEMIDFISHDMRSPMASLQALVAQLRQSPDKLTPQELLQKVEFHSRRGLDFADEFLSLAKVESEENIQVYEVDMYAVSQNAIDTLYEQALDKNIQLHLDAADDCWVMANGDMLERVILNLVSNAIKYSRNGTEVKVDISIPEPSSVHVAVTDQGEGIPVDLLPRLFKPFQRGTSEREVKSKGLGLGLRFVDVALKRHQSQIEVSSGSGGSCFSFTLSRLQF